MNYKLKVQKPQGGGWRNHPTTPKQQALLEFLKLPVPASKGESSDLITAAFEGPDGYAKQNAWDAAKYDLHPRLYASDIAATRQASKSGCFGSIVKGAALFVLACVVLPVVFRAFRERTEGEAPTSIPAKETPTAPAPPIPPAPLGSVTEHAPKPETVPPDMISLDSVDGRTITAKVLTLTKETVLIRRDDGQTFDLPLDRLTPESIKRIEDYREAKRRKNK